MQIATTAATVHDAHDHSPAPTTECGWTGLVAFLGFIVLIVGIAYAMLGMLAPRV